MNINDWGRKQPLHSESSVNPLSDVQSNVESPVELSQETLTSDEIDEIENNLETLHASNPALCGVIKARLLYWVYNCVNWVSKLLQVGIIIIILLDVSLKCYYTLSSKESAVKN